jgi:hypothetical protein
MAETRHPAVGISGFLGTDANSDGAEPDRLMPGAPYPQEFLIRESFVLPLLRLDGVYPSLLGCKNLHVRAIISPLLLRLIMALQLNP